MQYHLSAYARRPKELASPNLEVHIKQDDGLTNCDNRYISYIAAAAGAALVNWLRPHAHRCANSLAVSPPPTQLD